MNSNPVSEHLLKHLHLLITSPYHKDRGLQMIGPNYHLFPPQELPHVQQWH